MEFQARYESTCPPTSSGYQLGDQATILHLSLDLLDVGGGPFVRVVGSLVAITSNEVVERSGTTAAVLVRFVLDLTSVNGVEERSEDGPRDVQLVVTDKVGVVTVECVEDESLVSLRNADLGEALLVGEVQVGRESSHLETGLLGVHLEVDGLVWLNTDDKLVTRNVVEETLWCVLELNANGHLGLVEGLTCLEDKGDTVPSLVVDIQCECGESGAVAVLGHSVVVLVAWLAVGSSVLADKNVFLFNGGNRLENFYLFVTDVLCRERLGSFHGKQGEDLGQVVLLNITDNAEFVKVAASALSTERLLEGDLNVVDELVVEASIDQGVAETHDEQVFDHFFSEVVVDTESLLLLPETLEGTNHLSAALKVLAEGLLDDDTVVSLFGIAVLLETLCNDSEDVGRQCHVEKTAGVIVLHLALDALHLLVEVLERGILVVLTRDVLADLEEAFDILLALVIIDVLEVASDLVCKGVLAHLCSGIADNVGGLGEETKTEKVEEGGEGLFRKG